MTPEDVKLAREWLDKWEDVQNRIDGMTPAMQIIADNIRKSLAIVEKLLDEPTQEMRLAGIQAFVVNAIENRPEGWKNQEEKETPEYWMQMGREIVNSHDTAEVPFKAMRDQLIKEVEKEMEG